MELLLHRKGYLVFQTSSLVGFYCNNGVIWNTFLGRIIANLSNITANNKANIAVVRNIKANGRTFNNNAQQNRELKNSSGVTRFS
jgi:hypothetical protein